MPKGVYPRLPRKPSKNTDRFYRIWARMKYRCSNLKNKWYGAKGITVCEEWLSFKNFEKDMRPTYKEGLTLDRIDGSKGYYKENCKWSTWEEQNNNRRDNVFHEHNGKRMTLPQWARFLGVSYHLLQTRFYVYKWDINKCLTTPKREQKARITL